MALVSTTEICIPKIVHARPDSNPAHRVKGSFFCRATAANGAEDIFYHFDFDSDHRHRDENASPGTCQVVSVFAQVSSARSGTRNEISSVVTKQSNHHLRVKDDESYYDMTSISS